MSDLISVIVPIYRVEQYLHQCIQSIRNQTYKNLEIILVDDGSDDQCPQICDYYAHIDARIKVIHKKNGGVDSARKEGMLASSGKYIGYVDGDDWIETEMYARLHQYMHMYDVDVVESGVIDSWENRESIRTPYFNEGCYKDEIFVEIIESKLLYAGNFFEYGVPAYLWSKLFLKEKIQKYQMKSGIMNTLYDDTMVCLPSLAESKKLYITHECFYHYRVRINSLKRECRTTDIPNLFQCYHELYERFKGTILCSKDNNQIKFYIMYWLLLHAPYAFDNIPEGVFLRQYGGIGIGDKIVLYGAGAAGIHLENYIGNVTDNSIVCWMDKNYKSLERILDVKNPEDIRQYEYDYIIISILRERAVRSARNDLINLGVPENKILWIDKRYIDNPDLLLSKVVYQDKSLV